MKIEICLDNLESVSAAKAGGADRIESCASLAEGGLTPSYGFMQRAVSSFGAGVMVMLRPRSGDFFYSEAEMDVILDDLWAANEAGASGVVFGSLTMAGEVNQDQLRAVVSAAGQMEVTFHRAFDVTRDLSAALEILVAHGVTRVLTSGGAPSVQEGREKVAQLVVQAAGRIVILPGGGVCADNIATLSAEIGCVEMHLSARHEIDSPMIFRRPEIRMGAETIPPEYLLKQTSEDLVRKARQALQA